MPPARVARPETTSRRSDPPAYLRRSCLMTGQPTIALPRPAVVASLSPFGDKIAEALGRRLGRRHGHLPGSYHLVPSTPDSTDRIGLALSEVLDVRNMVEGFGMP